MDKKNFIKKLKELFIGKRTLKDRLLTALFPSLALSFILFLFGPLDLSHIAETYVDYTVLDILPYSLKIWGIIFAALFLISWIPGGKLHAWISSLFAGLAAAFYIQGNWMNIDLGALDGTAVEWQNYGDNALIGLALFLAIVMIPFLVHFFSRRVWKGYVIFTSVLLTVMQLIPLGMMLYDEYQNRPDSKVRYIVSKDKEYVLGKENIVVFILDYTGPQEMKALLSKYPETLAPFNDFLYFDNFNTEYVGTFPAAACLLTHQPYDQDIPYSKWLEKVYHSEEAESFYGQLKEAGWTTRIFNNTRIVAGKLANEYGKFDNIEKVETPQEFEINKNTYRKLIKLSFYRYFPLIMKAPFWLYTDEIDGMKILSENEKTWNRYNSLQKYLDQRLTVGDEERVYITYHYAGSHAPYRLDETGKEAVMTADVADQLAGHFYVISQYIQQMKDYQIYDSSSIIIMTDHGNFEYPHSIFFIKPAGQRQTEMTYNHAPVSQSEFMETVAELAGLEKGQFGRSVYDVPEDEERMRCTYIRWKDPDYPEIQGKSSNAMKEYCYIGDSDTVHQMIIDKDFTSIPLPYPFF